MQSTTRVCSEEIMDLIYEFANLKKTQRKTCTLTSFGSLCCCVSVNMHICLSVSAGTLPLPQGSLDRLRQHQHA